VPPPGCTAAAAGTRRRGEQGRRTCHAACSGTMDQMKITIALQMWGQFMAGPPDTGGDRSTHGFHSPAFALFIYWILQQMIFERCIALRGDGIWISTSSRFLYNRILAPHEPSIEV